MLDAAKAAAHPAIAEALILMQQERISDLEMQLATALANVDAEIVKKAARYDYIKQFGTSGETESLTHPRQVVYASIGFHGHELGAAIDARIAEKNGRAALAQQPQALQHCADAI